MTDDTPRCCHRVPGHRRAMTACPVRGKALHICLGFFLCMAAWTSAMAQDAAYGLNRQSINNPASPQAADVALLWWIMLAVATVAFLIVMAILLAGVLRARRWPESNLGDKASRNLVLVAGIAVPMLVIIFLVGGSLKMGAAFSAPPPDNALMIEVQGRRWWWELRYLDAAGNVIAVTANEMHVPAGRPVAVRLISEDVIHSFWVPELSGKTDVVPGQVNTSWFTPSETGTYRGQCSEYCGVQHALMAFLVVVEPEDAYNAWLDNERQDAIAPASDLAAAGAGVFMSSGCAGCHTIRGTNAIGILGPDLTHIGARQSLAAVTRPNTTGHLGGWIADPQGIKPGNLMPPTALQSNDLIALIDYLQSLQ